MVGAKGVAARAAERAKILTQHAHRARTRRYHAGDQAQQGRLAAAARPAQKDPLAAHDAQRLYVDDGCDGIRPREAHTGEFHDRRGQRVEVQGFGRSGGGSIHARMLTSLLSRVAWKHARLQAAPPRPGNRPGTPKKMGEFPRPRIGDSAVYLLPLLCCDFM
jgi:hypothetical protein